MPTRHVRTLTLVLFIAGLGLLACDASTLVGNLTGGASKPTVTIQSPANGSQFRDGEDIAIQSQARDSAGIVRIELSVDGAAVRTDQPPVPQGQVSFTVVQKWKATAGSHTLSVRAFNASGIASDPALVAITVSSSGAGTGPTTAPTQQIGLATLGTPTPDLSASPTSSLPTATFTRRPPTRAPATPTINAPPGVYVTNIRVSPPQPRRGENVTFFVTFLNTAGSPQSYRWVVLVYKPEQKNSFGESAPMLSMIPVGQTEQASSDNWAIRGGCDPTTMTARVFWVDSDNRKTEFLKPDRSGGPAHEFLSCPP